MRKFFLVMILSFSVSFAVNQGRLLNLNFATYAINSYSNNWQSPLSWSVTLADSLRAAVYQSITAMNILYGYEYISI